MKKFSVLISVYAREQSDYLRSALHSVFEQTVPPTELSWRLSLPIFVRNITL